MEGQPIDEKQEKEMKLAKIKYQIEQRYKRINTSKRRPSTEYIPSEEILELFLPFAANPTEFQSLSEEELQEFYTKWYVNMYKNGLETETKEGEERKEGEEEITDDSFELLKHLNITLPEPEVPEITLE